MPHRLLAVLTDPATTIACLDAAALAAPALPGCAIEALHVDVDPDRIVAAPEEIDFQRLRDAREGTATERAEAVRAAVERWQRDHPETPVGWRCEVGQQEEMVSARSKSADLIVLARGHDMDSGDALHAAIFGTDVPALLMPPAVAASSLSHIAIAWSGSDASGRAVAGAMPWLARAVRVTVIAIGEGSDAARDLAGDLGLGGIHAEIHAVPRGDGELGARIVGEAHAVGADALVAGAYRHNAMVEWLLGGTTRHLLSAADLPLFLAH
ncbi:universal stress protein [Sphingomonas donggukensis]|uniref:Universal stress protein n=1 Tax=Sphingomonas donggukensis TaxID=2949093 RepID=A0ABY4TRK6_9SPHN|nr:universal stress protein [Sphingomonas donggukensis]URW74872.1 universal stress protein [Sphingomonas donggukensis]